MTMYLQCNVNKALEISRWLQSQGLRYPIDYDYDDYLGNPNKYWFWLRDKKWNTLILLKYTGEDLSLIRFKDDV